MLNQVRVDQRFCGPPDSGNGGYCSGLLANFIGDAAKIRLHSPLPLDTELEVRESDDKFQLINGDTIIATGQEHDFDLSVPHMPDISDVYDAQARFVGHSDHVFPGCFVCGPNRREGDGLRVFPGPVVDGDWSLLACALTVPNELLDERAYVQPEFIWAALDCPSYFGVFGESMKLALLGEIELKMLSKVKGDRELVVTCWPIGVEGRKAWGGAALYSADGAVLAYARGTWITLK
jgi:hypothetical protein